MARVRFPRVFNDIGVNMVKAGSEGGFLEDALKESAPCSTTRRDEEQDSRRARKPVFVMTVGVLVVTVLLFSSFHSSTPSLRPCEPKGHCPKPLRRCLAISRIVKGYWWIVLGSVGLVGLGINHISKPTKKKTLRFAKNQDTFAGIRVSKLSIRSILPCSRTLPQERSSSVAGR